MLPVPYLGHHNLLEMFPFQDTTEDLLHAFWKERHTRLSKLFFAKKILISNQIVIDYSVLLLTYTTFFEQTSTN